MVKQVAESHRFKSVGLHEEMKKIHNPKNWRRHGSFKIGNPNHPKTGSRIKVEPIRSKEAITAIKNSLEDSPRDLALFTLGINTAYRANELLGLNIAEVQHLKAGDTLDIFQTKTNKYRRVVLSNTVVQSLQDWISSCNLDSSSPLFFSRKGGAISVPTLNNLVKKWCEGVGLVGNYGSHSLRKTWGYWQRKENKASLPLLMTAYGHSSQQQTLDYLCIQSDEISELYSYEL